MHRFDEGDGEALAIVVHNLGVGPARFLRLMAGEELENFGGLWGHHAVCREDEGVERLAVGFANVAIFGGLSFFTVEQGVEGSLVHTRPD